MAARTAVPGAEFYYERLARCRALPEQQRRADVRALLQCDTLLEEVGRALPHPAEGKPQPPDDVVAPAVARFLRARMLSPMQVVVHPTVGFERMMAALAPMAEVSELAAGQWHMHYCHVASFRQLMQSSTGRSSSSALVLLKAAALCAFAHQQPSIGRNSAHACMEWLQPSQLAAVDRRLRQLGVGSDIISAAGLRQLCLQETFSALLQDHSDALGCVAAAEQLLAEYPDSPRSHINAGIAIMHCKGVLQVEHRRTNLQHMQRALQLAEQQGCDSWIASCSFTLTHMVCGWVAMGLPIPPGIEGASSPSQLLATLQRADAARARMKGLLPQIWFAYLDQVAARARQLMPALQLLVEQDAESFSRAASSAAVRQALDGALGETGTLRISMVPVCTGCGEEAVAVRKCAACKQVQYCSRACQKAHWPEHKAACKAAAGAAKAPVGGGGGSSGTFGSAASRR